MPRRSSSLTQVVDGAIDREINSKYDDVKKVADNIDDVTIVANATAITAVVANNIDAITATGSSIVDIVAINSNIVDVTSVADNIVDVSMVATNIGNISSVVTTVVPNMAEILLADDRATTATSMAVTATTQAGLANTARVAAEVAKGIAETKATEAGASAAAADLSADLAAVSEGIASTKADEAVVSAAAAHTSELAAAALLDAFDDRYLGSYSVDPALDNDGQALLDGTLYYNTVSNVLKVYDTSSITWYTIPQVMLSALLDVQLTSVATGDVLSWNGSKWVNTKALTVNSVQLLGGISTQGTMTWNADEETVDVVQNGAILQLGQETQVHVRNNSGSSIADGKVVMATGTLGASGRITAGLYDGAADVKYVLGVATETIASGDDGKVTSFGKIRGVNTSAWNEGDVLYTTTAGGLTNVAPVTGVKLAVAMVITKHAVNGVIMVRVNGVNELAHEPKNTNIQTHIASTSNPHSVTKTQVGLSNVDNTSDATKSVLSATKLTTTRAIALTGDVTGTVNFDGSASVSMTTVVGDNTHSHGDSTITDVAWSKISGKPDPVVTVTLTGDVTGTANTTLTDLGNGTVSVATVVGDDSHLHTFANLTSKPTTLSGYGITDTYGTTTQDWRDSMMSKAQFNALASERRANRAGSGFDEWGKHFTSTSPVNEGMFPSASIPNTFFIGYDNVTTSLVTGISKTNMPYVSVNGIVSKILGINDINSPLRNNITLPPAPTIYPYNATLTPEQIASGVIKHADSSNSGLIANGKFDTDTSGWSNFDASLSIDANRLKITSNAGSTSGTFGVQMLSNLVVGKKYIVEFNAISISSGSLLFRVGSGTATQPFINIYSTTPIIGRNNIEFTATLTNHHIFMGLVTSAGQNAVYDNIAVFPSDAISRSDLVFLESWHEDVSEKDFVYPLGNVQYLGTTGDSGTPVVGAFAGSATYSLFSDTWQADGALVGKGYVWSALSDANKKAFVANAENNCYLDGDKVIQVRYRMRVVNGLGDSWEDIDSQNKASMRYISTKRVKPKGKLSLITNDLNDLSVGESSQFYSSTSTYSASYDNGSFFAINSANLLYDTRVAYEGKCFALPIALIHR